ncbi:transposase [Elysia marginata]|uniref:Transposase n=1 Tax=Elysia marginata TaxID=1093978 RepID=A0AAV4HB42_9GAST|nr:transposase [Elysia marginata]
MEAAVNIVLSGTSIRKAAEQLDLNYKTLGRYVKLQQKNGTLEGASFGRNWMQHCPLTPQLQLAQKGQKRVGSIVSQEKGVTVTRCGAISATGNSIPPFLVFPRVNVQKHWTLSAPPGTVCEGHPKASGWMTTENFLGFLRHFVKHTRQSEDLPVLLIFFDG